MTHQQKTNARYIALIAGLVLIVVTLVTSLSVFWLMQRFSKDTLKKSLQLSLQGRIQLLTSSIEQRIAATHTIATRPVIMDQMQIYLTAPKNQRARHILNRATRSFLKTGFSAIQIVSTHGKVISNAGAMVAHPVLAVMLNTHPATRLLWAQGFVLRTRIPFVRHHVTLGYILSEAPLPRLTHMLRTTGTLGKTGILALCAPLGRDMQCFPTPLHPEIFPHIARSLQGHPLPMAYALEGKTGAATTHDYRAQQVVAAYAPVATIGLGAVLKVDTAELYAPIWRQIRFIGPLLIVFLALGALLLKWLVSPLVRQLIVSERRAREANAHLHDSETRTRTILENIEEGIITVSPDGLIASANPAALRMLRHSSATLLGQPFSTLFPASRHAMLDAYRQQCTGTSAPTLAIELDALRHDSVTFPADLRMREMRLQGQQLFIAMLQNISQRKASENEIRHIATHDALTDLPNRTLLQDRIEQAIAASQRGDEGFAIIFVDLDDFKVINDSLGHDIGDKLLQSVAQRLQDCLRGEDTVARRGGDEFIIVLRRLGTSATAATVAQKLLATLTTTHLIEGHELHTAASLGIALYPDDGRDTDTLLKHSDAAMYQAKAVGHNHFRFFTTGMNANDA